MDFCVLTEKTLNNPFDVSLQLIINLNLQKLIDIILIYMYYYTMSETEINDDCLLTLWLISRLIVIIFLSHKGLNSQYSYINH